MFEKIRQKRAERLMAALDDLPITDDTWKQRNTLIEKIGRNGVAIHHNTQEYVALPGGEVLYPVTRKGTRRDRDRGESRCFHGIF